MIYQKSRELAKRVYEITRQGDFKFDTRFVQQIRAAAGSVSDNIAEGFERQGNKEFKNFLFIAVTISLLIFMSKFCFIIDFYN